MTRAQRRGGLPRGRRQPQGAGDRRRDELGIADRVQRDEEHAVGEFARSARPRAAARGASCRCRPGPVSVSSRVPASRRFPWLELLAADEAGQLTRQVVAWLPASAAAGTASGRPRRRAGRGARVRHSPSAGARRRRGSSMPGSRASAASSRVAPETSTWPPWPGRADARHLVDGEAHVVAVGDRHLAGVDARPHADLLAIGPRVSCSARCVGAAARAAPARSKPRRPRRPRSRRSPPPLRSTASRIRPRWLGQQGTRTASRCRSGAGLSPRYR